MRWALPLVFAALSLPSAADAQGLRGSLYTTARYMEFRPIRQDTVARNQVDEEGGFFFEGQRVYCRTDDCLYFRPAPAVRGIALTQDMQFTTWGLGVEGLSATALLRSRVDLGDEFVWPRSDDPFDALLAYAQLSRSHYRVQLGRLRNLDGLGFTGYEGAQLMVQPVRWLRVEAYGGRSLARALHQTRNDILRSLEDFVLDESAYVFGNSISFSLLPKTVFAGHYQRAIWADGAGLISERASLDLQSSFFAPIGLDASLDWDVGFGRLGKTHLRVNWPLELAGLHLQVGYRHYVPYFELSTVWGFFDPTGYNEENLRLTWQPHPALTTWGMLALRQYKETHTNILPPAEEDNTQRLGLGLVWRPGGLLSRWAVEGEYLLEDGFGAFLSSGDVRVHWQARPKLKLQIRSSAFQQIEDFRFGEGLVLGGGLSAAVRLWQTIQLEAGLDVYHQHFENRPSGVDWNQVRGWSALRIPLGADPGEAAKKR